MGLFDYNDIGIDLGTANVLGIHQGQGDRAAGAVGRRDRSQLRPNGGRGRGGARHARRTPGNIVAVRPLREGVISNFHDTERMLRFFLQKVIGASCSSSRGSLCACRAA